MIDFPAVRLSGAVEIARARVLWDKGVLRAFTEKGLVFEVACHELEVQPSWLVRRWLARTDRGELIMKARCMTCGGWRRVTKPTFKELWDGAEQ